MVERCCCGCCTVGTGTAIIAILDIIGAVIQSVRSTVTVIFMLSSPEQVSEDQYPEFRNYPAAYIASLCFGIFMAFVYGAFSALLFHGYRTKNFRLCKPWLYWNYISLTFVTVVIVVLFIILAIYGSFVVGLILAVVSAIIIGIAAYFVNVVQRFVDELKDGANCQLDRNIN